MATSSVQINPIAQSERKFAVMPCQPEDANFIVEEDVSGAGKLPIHDDTGGESSATKSPNEQQFEQLLSNILKYGVLIASTIVLIGGILYLIRHGAEPANYQFFQGEPSTFRSPTGVVEAVLSGSRRGIIQLGLLVLIATPIVRVTISLITFLLRRDFTYFTITFLVLVGLIYSLIGAYY